VGRLQGAFEILPGPLAPAFMAPREEKRTRVDFVRIPGVIKLHNGEYKSLGLHIDLDQTMEMRAAIIRQTALSFRPDLFLVDKEPLGLKGEVVPTLQMLKAQGTTLVLGLRDIMDEPTLLSREWEHKQVMPALESSSVPQRNRSTSGTSMSYFASSIRTSSAIVGGAGKMPVTHRLAEGGLGLADVCRPAGEPVKTFMDAFAETVMIKPVLLLHIRKHPAEQGRKPFLLEFQFAVAPE